MYTLYSMDSKEAGRLYLLFGERFSKRDTYDFWLKDALDASHSTYC
jgi:hypothetical protein